MTMAKTENRTIGICGENLAEKYLKSRNYRILGRNVRSPFGEIDFIAEHNRVLVFIEVKTRRSTLFGFPEEAVTNQKKARLIRLASWYLAVNPRIKKPVRFDVLAIMLNDAPEYRLIQNAFEVVK